LVTLPKIAGLEYWVQLLFNFTPVSVRQVWTGPKRENTKTTQNFQTILELMVGKLSTKVSLVNHQGERQFGSKATQLFLSSLRVDDKKLVFYSSIHQAATTEFQTCCLFIDVNRYPFLSLFNYFRNFTNVFTGNVTVLQTKFFNLIDAIRE